jgi:hypothetical protein
MTPIVDGLAEQYRDVVDFHLLDASMGEGKRFFDFYGTVGHPSYVLVDATGEVRWKGIGPLDGTQLEEEILKVLDK